MDCAVSGTLRLWPAMGECAFHLERLGARQSSITFCGVSTRLRHVRIRGRGRAKQVRYCLEPDKAAAAKVVDLSSNKRPAKHYVSGENAVEATEELLKSADDVSIVEENASASTFLQTSDSNMLERMRQIFAFAGPALGIWLSGPIMSLIDTSVVGITSSLELAALGPGTVVCDGLGYVFVFLSIATSNLIATSLANKDEAEAANHLARLLFVALFCGVVMFTIIKVWSKTMLRAFVGSNTAVIPAAACYVDIRAFAWPIVLATMVAQSASLGMQDSVSPLKVLVVASVVNAVGDLLLCTFMGYGIAGAAWATTLSQYVGGILMLKSLKDKGYDPLALSVPRIKDLVQMIKIAGPILLTMLSKVSFYTTITYFATSFGAVTLAAHQVMIGLFSLFAVWGEPLSQTAQSFMPGLIFGKSRDLRQARTLLQTLLVSGAVLGGALAAIGIAIPAFLPQLFTNDSEIIKQMHTLIIPFFFGICLTPPTLALEGTLLAGRDLIYLGLTMASSFACGSAILLLFQKLRFSLRSCWWIVVLFQATRFIASFSRLNSSKSILKEGAPLS